MIVYIFPMPRYKTISDEQVLDRLLALIANVGPDRLSFSLSAKACGLSAATLVQRYGNREALVETVLVHAWARLSAQTEAADEEVEITPSGAIEILIRLMPGDAAEFNATEGLLLLREDVRNPRLRAFGAEWFRQLEVALGRRLSRDPRQAERKARQMVALWQGALIRWAFVREASADQSVRMLLQDWLDGA